MDITDTIMAKIGSLLQKFFARPQIPSEYSDYVFEKDLTPDYSETKNRVTLQRDQSGNRYVVKRVSGQFQDQDKIFLRNEARILKQLSSLGVELSPKYIDYSESSSIASLVTGMVSGEKLEDLSVEERCGLIEKTLNELNKISSLLPPANNSLPSRDPLGFYFSLKLILIKLILKYPADLLKNIGYYLIFFANYFQSALVGVKMGLVHRDLFPDNILYDREKSKLHVLDWESAVVSDNLFDLSQVAVIYTHELGEERLIRILKDRLLTNSERRRFTALAVFNYMQIISFTPKDHHVHKEVVRNIELIIRKIMPRLMQKKSPFEIVNTITLDLIWFLYKFTGRNIFDKKNKIILCYHSVGADGWRFSTHPQQLEEHILMLKKHTNILPLDTLMSSKDGGVCITFDDGYVNLVENALPIFKKHNIVAGLFAIGNETGANRYELENKLPIMAIDGLKTLHSAGWEIGFHTATHVDLGKMDEAGLEREVVEGKAELEKKLGFPMRYFAYPRGIFTKNAIAAVKKAGFTNAFTVDGAAAKPGETDPYLIDRVPVEGELTAEQLMAIISPLGLRISHIYLKLLQLKEKLFPVKK